MGVNMEEKRATRRSFLGKLLAGTLLVGGGASLSSIFAYLFPPEGISSRLNPQLVKVGKAVDIPPGKGKLVLAGGEPVWIVHLVRGFVGISALCTHKGCIIRWEKERKVFSCPCHEGLFDEHGNVISGLPRRPLTLFRVGLVHDDLYVSRRKERLV